MDFDGRRVGDASYTIDRRRHAHTECFGSHLGFAASGHLHSDFEEDTDISIMKITFRV